MYLSWLYQDYLLSGIQYLVEIPEGKSVVLDYLSALPVIWNKTCFIDGFPGMFPVVAIWAGRVWYICGINGAEVGMCLNLNLSVVGKVKGSLLQIDKYV